MTLASVVDSDLDFRSRMAREALEEAFEREKTLRDKVFSREVYVRVPNRTGTIELRRTGPLADDILASIDGPGYDEIGVWKAEEIVGEFASLYGEMTGQDVSVYHH